MDGLITSAQTDNLDLAAAAARVLEADANTDIQGAALFPSIDLSAGAQRTGAKISGHWISQNSFGASLDATYQVDFWARRAPICAMRRNR